jgi:hypothetical protein
MPGGSVDVSGIQPFPHAVHAMEDVFPQVARLAGFEPRDPLLRTSSAACARSADHQVSGHVSVSVINRGFPATPRSQAREGFLMVTGHLIGTGADLVFLGRAGEGVQPQDIGMGSLKT